jgi:hypothetical protein
LSGSIFYYIGLCGKTPDENSLKDSMVNQEFGGRLIRTTGAQKVTFNVQISFFLLCGHIYYIFFFVIFMFRKRQLLQAFSPYYIFTTIPFTRGMLFWRYTFLSNQSGSYSLENFTTESLSFRRIQWGGCVVLVLLSKNCTLRY